MTEAELRGIAFVQAVEETSADLLPATARDQAGLAAGDRRDAGAWVARRARCLLDGPLARFRPAVDHLELRVGALGWILPAAIVVGLLGNSLGPTRKIHVLYNPIGLLVAWNLVVYVALLALRLRRWKRPSRPAPTRLPTSERSDGATSVPTFVPAPHDRGGLLERALLGWLRRHVVAVQTAAWNVWSGVRTASALVAAFVSNWFATMRPALHHATRTALHLGAVGMALGAVAGMYVRGLFLDYDVVWRSTFVESPDGVAWLLRLVLAPAAWVLRDALPSASDATALMTVDGAPAARWIHLLAVTVLLAVVVPRLGMAAVSSLAYRRTLGRLGLSPDEPYVRGLLAAAARLDVQKVQDDIRADITQAFDDFRTRLADYVASELHEKRIEPELDGFRERGGKLSDLEARLDERCRAFEPDLRGEIGRQQLLLEGQITERVAWRLGGAAAQQLTGDDVATAVGGAASGVALRAGTRAGDQVAAGVGAIVSGAVATVSGTVSGGFGHSLGTALLVGAIHSGPVAWVVGAVGGALVAGAALYVGKDALRDGVKRVSLPPGVAKLALLRIDAIKRDGRARCRTAVCEGLGRHFECDAVVERTAAAIWSRLLPLLGAQLGAGAQAGSAKE